MSFLAICGSALSDPLFLPPIVSYGVVVGVVVVVAAGVVVVVVVVVVEVEVVVCSGSSS